MTKAEAIEKAEKEGTLDLLIRAGLVDPRCLFYKEIYEHVTLKIRAGCPPMKVYTEYSISTRYSDDHIRAICRNMAQEIGT